MRTVRYLFFLSCSTAAVADPEWQIFFPDQAAVIDGQYIDHNEALVVKYVANQVTTDRLDLSEITGLNIPDNAAVTGFTAKNNGGPSNTASFIFSVATAFDGFQTGDVIECNSDGCLLLETLGSDVSISALDYNNLDDQLLVSFDTGFEVNGAYIDPLGVYSVADFSLVFDGFVSGLGDNNAITAFDTSGIGVTWSPLRMFTSSDGLVKASQVYSPTLNTINFASSELGESVTGVGAYYSVDSGWLEFAVSTITVSEGAGSLTFNLSRVGGIENGTSAVVQDLDGTAVDGVDYEGLLNQYFWFDGNADTYEISIDLIDDNDINGNRTFQIELSERNSDYSFSLVNPNKNLITVTITDDDAGDLIFASGFE